jgi:hypothetical protein
VLDDTLLLLFNAAEAAVDFVLPLEQGAPDWELLLDTRDAKLPGADAPRLQGGATYAVHALSLAVFRQPRSSPYQVPLTP